MAFTKITSTNIAANTVAGYAEFANFANSLTPKITSIAITSNTYSVLDDTAVNVGGGFIVVTGTDFQSGATVLIDTTPATAVSYINNTTLRVQVPAKTAASYNLYVVNPDGGTGIRVSGITYSASPTWVTSSPLANVTSNTVFSGNVSATGATSYANTTILPTGFNLLANGYYFGNISVGAATTYSFDLRATDNELQDSNKTFSLTATMTAPTLLAGGTAGVPSGGVSASSNIDPGDRRAEDAFDNSLDATTACYHSAQNPGSVTFRINFGSAKTLSYYRFVSRYTDNDWKPGTWTLQGSTDNSTWTTIDSRSGQALLIPNTNSTNLSTEIAAGRYAEYNVTSPGNYQYYEFIFTHKLNISKTGEDSLSTGYLVIGEMMLYGY
jgi:hypothetical protein